MVHSGSGGDVGPRPTRAPARRLVADAVDRGGMSARGVHRALRVARTIADLAGEERIGAIRLAEALQYRAYESRRAGVE